MTCQLSLFKNQWLSNAETVVCSIMQGREFSTDDLHGKLPEPECPNWFGIAMAKLKNKGLVERTGYKPSERPLANGRPIAIWRLR